MQGISLQAVNYYVQTYNEKKISEGVFTLRFDPFSLIIAIKIFFEFIIKGGGGGIYDRNMPKVFLPTMCTTLKVKVVLTIKLLFITTTCRIWPI